MSLSGRRGSFLDQLQETLGASNRSTGNTRAADRHHQRTHCQRQDQYGGRVVARECRGSASDAAMSL